MTDHDDDRPTDHDDTHSLRLTAIRDDDRTLVLVELCNGMDPDQIRHACAAIIDAAHDLTREADNDIARMN